MQGLSVAGLAHFGMARGVQLKPWLPLATELATRYSMDTTLDTTVLIPKAPQRTDAMPIAVWSLVRVA